MKLWGNKSKGPQQALKGEKTTFDHPQLGLVTLNRSLRATRISLSVDAKANVKLTIPYNYDKSMGIKFLNTKIDWILGAMQRAEKRNVERNKIIEPPFSTKFHRLRLEAQQRSNVGIVVSDNELIVSYPSNMDYKSPNIQAIISQAIEKLCRTEAQGYLPQRVEQLAQYCRQREPRYKWQCGKVSVRKARTRWGSCAANNNLSLNISLMLLPDRLIDYVILHELTHTVHKNHSSDFHNLLDRLLMGNEAALSKEMKNFRTME